MTRWLMAAMLLLLVAPRPAIAQGLIAHPFLSCPTVGGNFLCVWVTNRLFEAFSDREDVYTVFWIAALNPGRNPLASQVRVMHFNADGVFQRLFELSIDPGQSESFGGISFLSGDTFIVTSPRPLLLWASKVERYVHRGEPFRHPSRAAAREHVPLIPVDCSQPTDNFAWVCDRASGGPPPPN